MKFVNFLLPIIMVTCGIVTPLAADSHKQKLADPDSHKACSKKNKPTPICKKSIGGNGFVITTPGEYFLTEDVVYNPCGSNPAIRISIEAVGNVTLDLKGHTISQKMKSGFVNGITVDPGLTNITLKNGTVSGFSNYGVVFGDPNVINQTYITDIKISNINCFNNGISDPTVVYSSPTECGGLLIVNGQDIVLENDRMNGNAGNGFEGTNLIKLVAENCHFDDNTWANLQFQGLAPNPAINYAQAAGVNIGAISPTLPPSLRGSVTFRNCSFDRNNSIGIVFGFVVNGTRDCRLESCTANANNATVSDKAVVDAIVALAGSTFIINGINIGSNDSSVNNCQIFRTQLTVNTPFPTGGFNAVQGLSIGGNNLKVTNTDVGDQTFLNNSDVGLKMFNQSIASFGNSPIYIANCNTSGNFNGPSPAPSQQVVAGIDLAGNPNSLIEDCFSSGHSQNAQNPGVPGSEFSYVAGFKTSFFNLGSVVFRRCVASGNTDPGTGGGAAYGFTTRENQAPGDLNSTIVFDSCISEKNTTGLSTGYGFDIFNTTGSKVINCIAEANNIGINVSDFVSASTTVAASSNGVSLPTATINVASTAGFTTSEFTGLGTFVVVTSDGPQLVTYTGTTPTSFTGVSGGYGKLSTGALVVEGSSFDNIFRGNILEANTQYGIRDTSYFSNTNAYYQNQAKNNGAFPANGKKDTNFSGGILSTKGTPIRYWRLPHHPKNKNNACNVGETLDNISIN